MTSTCTVCGRFLSRGARHDLSTSCWPPQAVLGPLRVPTIVTPFHAWPPENLHHSALGRTATSPLRGLGPRLVVALARHRAVALACRPRTRRFGPAAALRELLDEGPAAALQAVLHPAPAIVRCGGDLHAIGLEGPDVVLHDHPGVDVDSELVAAALTGTPVSGCLRAAHQWQERDGAHTPTALGQLPVLEAARDWHAEGADLVDTDPWIGAAWRPAALRRAVAAGLDDEDVLRWLPVSRLPEVARAWRDTGWTVREVRELLPHLSPPQAAAWRAAGLDVNRISEARRTGLSLLEATAWHEARWPLLLAGALAARGARVDDAEEVLAVVRRRGDVVSLAVAGVTTVPELRRVCAERGLEPPQLVERLPRRYG